MDILKYHTEKIFIPIGSKRKIKTGINDQLLICGQDVESRITDIKSVEFGQQNGEYGAVIEITLRFWIDEDTYKNYINKPKLQRIK